jgi:hypothetical protein
MNTSRRRKLMQIASALVLMILPASARGVELGTRHRTILPSAVAPETPPVAPSNVSEYLTSDYGKWTWGPGTNEGQKLTLMPAGQRVRPTWRRCCLSFPWPTST